MAHYGASNGWLGTLCVLFTASAALSFAAPSASAPKGDLAKADRYYVEKSYRLAREIYDAFLADPASAKSPRFREIQFKAADCFAKEDPQANREEALKRLEDLTSKAPYDQWWARANQSRAELLQQVDPWGGMDKIQESLLAAIGFWGHSTDVERGLPLYLELNFKLGEMINQRWSWQVCEGAFQVVDEPPYVRRRPGPPVPPEKQNFDADLARWAFQNIIQRAADKEDKARALFLLAQRDNQIWRPLKDKNAAERAKKEARESLLTIINDLGQTKAAPDALLLMAQILNEAQDYVGALERLEQLTAQFRRGEAAAYDQAQQMIREIANPQCSIQCGQSFPPGSYIQANLQYRNIDAVAYELWRVDPAAVVKNAPNLKDRFGDWGSMIAAAPGAEKMRSWNDDKIVADKKHIPHSQPTYLDPLGPGLYVLKASPAPAVQKRRDEDIESQLRAVFLVSDLALTVKTGKTDLYAFVTNAITGVPVPEAKVTVIHKWSQQMPRPLKLLGEQWIDNAEVIEGLTEGNGLAKVALPPATHEQGKTRNHQYLVAAVAGDAPAFAGGQYWWGGRPTEKQTVFYAYSDRPAYRPKETIQFKVIAREYDGWNYSMPERQKYLARITDPQGNQVFEQTMDVNEYGSFAGEMKLGEEPPLGMYNLQFLDPQTKGQLGMAPLARVEEYKLPEFKVEISSKEAAYRLGDEMKVSIQADYYFGGPVADAEVTVVVHERPFTYSYWWPRPYPWFWEESGGIIPPWRRAPEKTVKEDKLKTDAQGKATLTIPTPKDSKTDLAYRIEVRVVDQSRREIRGEKELKVTKKEYFATLHPAHCVYRPNDKVEVDVKTKNANDEPVARQAEMRISQLEWTDKPFELEGKQVDKGYKPTLLSTQPIATNDQGEAKFAWSPNKPGYYEFEWAGKDKYGETVSGKTRIWVAAPGDHDIGYRYGGIQIVVDRESYQKGDTARLLLTSFLPHGFVLLTVESEDIYSAQVRTRKSTGPAKRARRRSRRWTGRASRFRPRCRWGWSIRRSTTSRANWPKTSASSSMARNAASRSRPKPACKGSRSPSSPRTTRARL
ncbi:MAG: MG2 domain-containing protein [Candidatus Sumerlaeota bacterium]|nr:MG2 domain-containing protein [Candidatus Sumerlaeota bacterium]